MLHALCSKAPLLFVEEFGERVAVRRWLIGAKGSLEAPGSADDGCLGYALVASQGVAGDTAGALQFVHASESCGQIELVLGNGRGLACRLGAESLIEEGRGLPACCHRLRQVVEPQAGLTYVEGEQVKSEDEA